MNWLGLLFLGLGFLSLACGVVASYLSNTPQAHAPQKLRAEQKPLPSASSYALWRERRTLRHAKQLESETARRLRPQLYSEDGAEVLAAVVSLGALCDRTAVPALMEVLESCVSYQPLGWREIAVASTDALAQIGDPRSLPLLRRLETVRGIGLIPNIRHAIAIIDPQANLLRAEYGLNAVPEYLLRPAKEIAEAPETLLRSAGSCLEPLD